MHAAAEARIAGCVCAERGADAIIANATTSKRFLLTIQGCSVRAQAAPRCFVKIGVASAKECDSTQPTDADINTHSVTCVAARGSVSYVPARWPNALEPALAAVTATAHAWG
jgi:hypothetical protein